MRAENKTKQNKKPDGCEFEKGHKMPETPWITGGKFEIFILPDNWVGYRFFITYICRICRKQKKEFNNIELEQSAEWGSDGNFYKLKP